MAVTAASALTQETYAITVEAGAKQTFEAFGASQVGKEFDHFPPEPYRSRMADLVYRDLGAKVVRLWVPSGLDGAPIGLASILMDAVAVPVLSDWAVVAEVITGPPVLSVGIAFCVGSELRWPLKLVSTSMARHCRVKGEVIHDGEHAQLAAVGDPRALALIRGTLLALQWAWLLTDIYTNSGPGLRPSGWIGCLRRLCEACQKPPQVAATVLTMVPCMNPKPEPEAAQEAHNKHVAKIRMPGSSSRHPVRCFQYPSGVFCWEWAAP